MIHAMIGAAIAAAAPPQCLPVRAMTYNIRLDTASDGDNQWDKRRHFFVEQVALMRPDVLGLQEVVARQLQDLKQALPDYRFVGVARDDGKSAGEYSSLAVHRDRMKILDSGTFWLSPTPDRPSKGWDASFIRIATWASLVDRRNGQKIFAVNTHLDNEGVIARKEAAMQIRRWLERKARPGMRLIVTGDFNSLPDAAPVKTLTEATPAFQLRDSHDASIGAPVGSEGTFNGFNANPDQPPRIDYILADDRWRVDRYAVLNWQQDGRVASDHFPVVVDLADARCAQKGK